VGYDAPARTLEVEFVDRRRYRYFRVSKARYLDLIKVPSVGRYYSEHIRDAGYPFEELQ
jgi:hypothetical protein